MEGKSQSGFGLYRLYTSHFFWQNLITLDTLLEYKRIFKSESKRISSKSCPKNLHLPLRNYSKRCTLHHLRDWWNVQRTNLENTSLISVDRNNKATLLLTILGSIKVVCNGFILSNILYCYSEATKNTLPCLRNPPCYDARFENLFVIIWLGEGKNHRVLAWILT